MIGLPVKHAAFGVFVAPSWPPLLSCITCFLPSIQTAPLPPLEPSRVLPLLKERFKNGGARKSQPVGNCRFYGSREGFSSSIWEFFFFFFTKRAKVKLHPRLCLDPLLLTRPTCTRTLPPSSDQLHLQSTRWNDSRPASMLSAGCGSLVSAPL